LAQIPIPKQHLQLKGSEGSRRFTTGSSDPTERPRGQTLMAQPEALPIIGQYAHGIAPLIAEDKKSPAEGIAVEAFPTDLAQSIDAGSEIDRLHTYQNTHMRGDLNHWLSSRKAVMRGKN